MERREKFSANLVSTRCMLHVFPGDEWQGSSSHIIMYNTIAG